MAESKFSVLYQVTDKQDQQSKENVDDIIKQAKLEKEIERHDAKTQQKIDEVNNTPVDMEQVKSELTMRKKHALRQVEVEKENSIRKAKFDVEDAEKILGSAKLKYSDVVMLSQEELERNSSIIEQEYNRGISQLSNTDKAKELQIKKIRAEAEERKSDIQIALDTLTIMNEAKAESAKNYEKLYKDIVEISKSQMVQK